MRKFESLLRGIHIDGDGVPIVKFAAQDFGGQRIFDALLDHALQWPCTERGVVTLFGKQFHRTFAEQQFQMAVAKSLAQVIELYIGDSLDLVAREGMKQN